MQSMQQQLQQLANLGRQMMSAAEAGEWAVVGMLRGEFQAAAQAVCRKPPVREDIPLVTASLVSALQLSNQVMNLCAQARAMNMDELDQASRSRVALKHYSEHSR